MVNSVEMHLPCPPPMAACSFLAPQPLPPAGPRTGAQNPDWTLPARLPTPPPVPEPWQSFVLVFVPKLLGFPVLQVSAGVVGSIRPPFPALSRWGILAFADLGSKPKSYLSSGEPGREVGAEARRVSPGTACVQWPL